MRGALKYLSYEKTRPDVSRRQARTIRDVLSAICTLDISLCESIRASSKDFESIF